MNSGPAIPALEQSSKRLIKDESIDYPNLKLQQLAFFGEVAPAEVSPFRSEFPHHQLIAASYAGCQDAAFVCTGDGAAWSHMFIVADDRASCFSRG
ncbi:unnamed protein product [Phytophthora fragariaefolia]|uniref:Unnamed protein product n=1 Tax=Phytophthora fragariaefolia TaxID=1490495 RepID=A0A9W6XN30_9STRA|nr:unnamed protein product [Phytophthora fragariaefolia]